MIEFIGQILVEIFAVIVKFCFDLGWIIYTFFFESKLEKESMSSVMRIILGVIGTVIVASLLFLFIIGIFYLIYVIN